MYGGGGQRVSAAVLLLYSRYVMPELAQYYRVLGPHSTCDDVKRVQAGTRRVGCIGQAEALVVQSWLLLLKPSPVGRMLEGLPKRTDVGLVFSKCMMYS